MIIVTYSYCIDSCLILFIYTDRWWGFWPPVESMIHLSHVLPARRPIIPPHRRTFTGQFVSLLRVKEARPAPGLR